VVKSGSCELLQRSRCATGGGAPETWAKRAYPNLVYFHGVDKGGHFAAWEQPQLFAAEMRAAFKSLR
jgi:pimeloyl-ACP methyl ester carboxylesterase